MTDQSLSTPEELEQARQFGQGIFQKWVDIQREKYGENWKDTLSAEMAERMSPVLKAFLPKQESAETQDK